MAEKQATGGMIGDKDAVDSMGEDMPTKGVLDGNAAAILDPIPSAVNCFKDAEEFVHETRTANATVAIIIERNGVTQNTIGTPGMTPFKWQNNQNITIRQESRDYIVNIDDYRFNAVAVKPQKGDKITETVDGTKYTYEVLPFNKEPVWLYSGTYRTAYRIHTKQINRELA